MTASQHSQLDTVTVAVVTAEASQVGKQEAEALGKGRAVTSCREDEGA